MLIHVKTMTNTAVRQGYSPYYNSETQTWWSWDETTQEYVDTEIPATPYKEAVENGYEGTEEEYYALLATFPEYATRAETAAEGAETSEDEAEAWARGTVDGVEVPTTAAQYHNNSKYYAELAESYKDLAEGYKDAALSAKDEALTASAHASDMVTMAYVYLGSVATYNDLPASPSVGDVYIVRTSDNTHGISAGDEVVWNGAAWELLNTVITSEEIDEIIQAIS